MCYIFVMEIVRLILWFIAYTVGVIRLFAAALLLYKYRKQEDLKKVLFLITFGGVIISLSNMELLNIFGSLRADFAGNIGLVFSCLLIITIPLYVHSAVLVKNHLLRDVAAAIIGIGLLVFQFLIVGPTTLIIIIVMSVSIIYSMTLLVIYSKRNSAFENKMSQALGLVVILLIVLMIIFDFLFPMTDGYIFVPILYLFVNVMMIIPELPLLFRSSINADDEQMVEQMICIGLSKRECEVAMMLIRGRSYQEIGDKLYISLQTVKTHAGKIYSKTQTGSKLELLDKLKNACS